MMRVYKLTSNERQVIEALNSSRKNVLMVICDLGVGFESVLDYIDLEHSIFSKYKEALGDPLNPAQIADIP